MAKIDLGGLPAILSRKGVKKNKIFVLIMKTKIIFIAFLEDTVSSPNTLS